MYKIDYRLHLLFNKINPFYLIYKTSFFKQKFESKDVDIQKTINESFSDPDFGISSIRAGGGIHILTFLVLYSIINLISVLVFKFSDLSIIHIVIIIALSVVLNEFVFFKEDIYLEYLKEFEQMEKERKNKYYILSIFAIIGVLIITISSLFLVY